MIRGMGKMTVPQAAAMLGMHRTRIWQLVKSGKLIAEKTGRDWLIEDADVERLKAEPRKRVGRPRTGDGSTSAPTDA